MKHIVIFSNCAGNIIKHMFEKHSFTKDKYVIHYFANYENLTKKNIEETHMSIFKNCDVFIYQPLNQHYSNTEYEISHIKEYLKSDTIILKVNYYRFRGFWYDSEHKPYEIYNHYKFLNYKYYGIHNSFINFDSIHKSDVIKKINDIQISKEEVVTFFNQEILNFKIIDDNSDVTMFNYFINNYKNKHLFHDPFHPTNLFFYEIFRQIILKLDQYELIVEDYEFIHSLNDIEMTHWALPILPIIKKTLELNLDDYIYVFFPQDKLYMNIYDYYYIRLSPENFKLYLN